MRHLELFEEYYEKTDGRKFSDTLGITEYTEDDLLKMLADVDGDPDLDPATPWTPEEAIEWGVGFGREYGLWHPDENAEDTIWDGNTPHDLGLAQQQMNNFVSAFPTNVVDHYVITMAITNAISEDQIYNLDMSPQEIKRVMKIVPKKS